MNTHADEQRRTRAGFTLVELLLVVTILGILAAVVVTNFKGQSVEARINATRASIAAIKTAVDGFEVRMGLIPDTLDELTVGTEDRPAALQKGSLNDSWGNPFLYKKVGKYEFEIRSAGPDKQAGTPDDITN